MTNVLTVDVEDYFHPSEVQRRASPGSWHELPPRVEAATERVLDLLDRHGVKATFFVLGWVAERQPALVSAIASAGHEIGCHSYAHQLVWHLSPQRFREDTLRAKEAIENTIGVPVIVYRAPSYSITARSLWALEVLVECGFQYDSSIYPVHHDRYGMPEFGRRARVVQTPAGPIMEVPVATVRLAGFLQAPVGGGAYLRLLPYRYTAAGIRRINRTEHRPACVYFHPWEIDASQPRLIRPGLARFRTCAGLSRMEAKLERLMSEFTFSTLTSVHRADLSPIPAAGSSSSG